MNAKIPGGTPTQPDTKQEQQHQQKQVGFRRQSLHQQIERNRGQRPKGTRRLGKSPRAETEGKQVNRIAPAEPAIRLTGNADTLQQLFQPDGHPK